MRWVGRSLTVAAVLAGLARGATPAPLKSPSDREAFRRWFTFLAESRYYARRTARDIPDAKALVRWSFKEALSDHGVAWGRATELPIFPHMPSVGEREARQAGSVTGEDLPANHFVSRDARDLRPGDLLRFESPGSTAGL